MMNLTDTERRLLNLIQADFPLVPEPYGEMGRRLGINQAEVIAAIARLKEARIIRQIGPVMEARRLGYKSTLVALKIADAAMSRARLVIDAHPGISHAYIREHDFNVWLTMAVPGTARMDEEVARVIQLAGAADGVSLPAIRMFKIGTYFDMAAGSAPSRKSRVPADGGPAALTERERKVINKLQQDLSLSPLPFAAMAASTGMGTENFLACCRSLIERRVIRRYSAAINHNLAGFSANAMSCWAIPASSVAMVGRRLAALKEVSHCYERQTVGEWRYNLFAMIHGHSRELCARLAAAVAAETCQADYIQLYSTAELKKTRVRYCV